MGGLKKGFGAVKRMKKASDENNKAMATSRSRDLVLRKDGEEAELWFNGASDEPYVYKVHGIKLNANLFMTELCAGGFEDHDGCVYCWRQKRKGDKRISPAKDAAFFSVVDTRWVHKRVNKEKTASSGGKFERFDWFDCDATDNETKEDDCKYCKKGVPRERRGVCKLRLGVQTAGVLDGINDSLMRKCTACGTGKCRLTGYKNGNKTVPDIDDVENPEDWEAQFECNKCDEPAPGNIHLLPITMRRTGTGMQTQYNFVPGQFSDPPKWVQKKDPLDLSEMRPRSAEKMAELLKCDNPFEDGGKGASKYDDDDVDEEDEDGEEDTPRNRKKGKKPEEDDDEDEDGILSDGDDEDDEPKKKKKSSDEDDEDEED